MKAGGEREDGVSPGPDVPRYYGLAAIRRSLAHFVVGKGFSALSSLIVLALVLRELPVPEFAVYTLLHALVLMLGLISSFGVNPVLLRFLPELRAAGANYAMYRLLGRGIVSRAATFALTAGIVLIFTDAIGDALKLGPWKWLLPWYLLVGLFRISATFTADALQSLLWQRESQYSLVAGGIVKLLGVSFLVANGSLSLPGLVAVEAVAEVLSFLLLIGWARHRWKNDELRDTGDRNLLKRESSRYAKFGRWAYLQNLTSALQGSAPNRLLIGYFLPLEVIASYGAVDRLIEYVRRYEPMKMFLGMVRPIFNSRYRGQSDFEGLVTLANILLRINVVVLLVPLIVVLVAGRTLFDAISAGNYTDTVNLFVGFYVIAIIASVNTILDLLVKVLEKAKIFTFSNLVLSGSIAVAIPLIDRMGLWALVVANGLGWLVSLGIVLTYLGGSGFRVRTDWSQLGVMVGGAATAALAGRALVQAGTPEWLAAVLALPVFFLFFLLFATMFAQDVELVRTLLGRRFRAKGRTL